MDLGCGAGDGLAEITSRCGASGIGIDLATAACDRAARRFPGPTWVVANADRQLPLLDDCVDLVVSIHGRRSPEEAARILAPGRHFLIALPAPDDLIELRTLVQGARIERDRSDAVLAEHQPRFEMMERSVIRETLALGQRALLDLLRGTYRGERHAAADRVASLESMDVTLASEVLLFRLR